MASQESYSQLYPSTRLQSTHNYENGFTFVDFWPQKIGRGGFLNLIPKYETFRSLVERANDWLRQNPQFKIKTCESVEFEFKKRQTDLEKMIYTVDADGTMFYMRGLRLWGSNDGDGKGQQIGYIDMVPQKKKGGGIFSSAVYESLDEVINRFNSMVGAQPLPGRIITIETQDMETGEFGGFKPETAGWVDSATMANHYVYVIKVYFEITDAKFEEIGIQDFTPNLLNKGGIFKSAEYELFSTLLSKASSWCSQQTDIRLCNAQSLEILTRNGNLANSQKMEYSVRRSSYNDFLRILRLAYVKPSIHSKFDYKPSPVTHISCKSFVPLQLTNVVVGVPKFESLSSTSQRISAWMKATGADVISWETTTMRLHGEGEKKYGTEYTSTTVGGSLDYSVVYVIRAYISGPYVEPPANMLPPIPVIQKENCCIQ